MSTDDIHILPSSDSTILISSNVTNSSSSSNFSSTSSNSSSSVELTLYSSERIYYLLKNEKQQYTIIKNKVSPPAGFYWTIFGFPAKLNKKTGIFERINGYTSCEKCKKTFVYGPNSGTRNMKQHPCVTDLITQSISSSKDVSMTQTTIEKTMVIRKTLTIEQSKTIKDLIVRWICSDIRPVSVIEDDGLRA
ncbi:unnamed protein product, partial [Rotaria sp. Silwood2]